MLDEIPYGSVAHGKKSGAFVALTATSKLYKDYEDPTMTPEYRNTSFPVALMIHRWDGRLGFPGGFAENGENPSDVALRELMEEVGYDATGILKGVCAHAAEKFVAHLHHAHLGELSVSELQQLLIKASKAEHAVVEGCPIWVHLQDYGRGKGLPVLMNSNMLAMAVREELQIIIHRI